MRYSNHFLTGLLCVALLGGTLRQAIAQKPSRKKTAKVAPRKAGPRQPAVRPATRITFSGEPVPVENAAVSQNLSIALLRTASYHQYLQRFRKRAVAEYFPIIEKYLYRYQIPEDFKYLAVVESGLRADAVSHKGAMGYWQLMPETARELGLTVSPTLDERKDLHKSTDAACRYLRVLYRNLGSWTMVAAAYNGGIGRMQSHMRKQRESNYYFLSMNQETSQYLYKIVAVKEFFNNPALANPALMASLGNEYERERADAIARGVLIEEEPEPEGLPILPLSAGERLAEGASVDSLLNSLGKVPVIATAEAPAFRGDVQAELVKAGKPVLGQTWQFRITEEAQIGDQKLAKNDLLLAVVDDVDARTGQIFFRTTKIVSETTKEVAQVTLICLNPRTGLAGVKLPKPAKPGWTVGWKAI
ncbi:lytic transglycosylase domain-containing protein [Tellurirhabdus rosea]|uniref:lytic transglycosylase domain-containing protein n=1 Tax=Tellurirhabdus rosea TaxID=2674997 RepID=UPI002255D58C|nr:lytic transglycosylase domain-containing protein [Tellurirhabdus rosea]